MYDLLVVVHVVSAAVWVGGVVALTFVAVPVAQRQTGTLRGELLRDFGRRWRPLGWGALALAIAALVVGLAVLARDAARGRARLALAACLVLMTTPYLAVWYLAWAVPLAAAEEDAVATVAVLALCAYLLPQTIPI